MAQVHRNRQVQRIERVQQVAGISHIYQWEENDMGALIGFIVGYLLQRLVFDRVTGVNPAFQIVATCDGSAYFVTSEDSKIQQQ